MVTRRKTPCTCKPCRTCGGWGQPKGWYSPELGCPVCEGTGLTDLNCHVHFPMNAAFADFDRAWGEFREAIYAAIIPGIYRAFIALDDFKTWRARRRINRFLRPSLSVRLARRFPRIFNRNGDLF